LTSASSHQMQHNINTRFQARDTRNTRESNTERPQGITYPWILTGVCKDSRRCSIRATEAIADTGYAVLSTLARSERTLAKGCKESWAVDTHCGHALWTDTHYGHLLKTPCICCLAELGSTRIQCGIYNQNDHQHGIYNPYVRDNKIVNKSRLLSPIAHPSQELS